PLYSASGDAGTATQLGLHLLRAELRIPSRTLGTSGREQSTAIHCHWLRLGGGLGLREILRPSQSRQTDGQAGTANQRQAIAKADSSFSPCRRAGRWVGESEG